jgi:predicted nucleic acid-binding protein
MAASVIVDSSFVIAALSARDNHHRWAVATAERFSLPWRTCEAALAEGFHFLAATRGSALAGLLQRQALTVSFQLNESRDRVVELMEKYSDVPMSLADACLVRMTELLPDPVLLTTDSDFKIYRRLGRQSLPCILPD